MATAGTIAPSRWMISPLWDGILFIASPLLCALVILPLGSVIGSLEIYAFVLAFVSFGHHLPGFMRAYGDHDLFTQYRLRFILGPIGAFLAFYYFAIHNLNGMILLLIMWDLWHLMMQHYGFMRIYDAKIGSTSRITARLDFWMCFGWFLTIALWSPLYRSSLLTQMYQTGVPYVAPQIFSSFLWITTIATIAVTLTNLIHCCMKFQSKQPLSSVKWLLHGITILFLYTVWIWAEDLYLGIATFNVFHAVQYFAVVWIFNRNLVDRGHSVTVFTRFLFRGHNLLIALYLILILGYGGLNFIGQQYVQYFPVSEQLITILLALGGTSTFLHYYFDGFIWKVRQKKTRQALALEEHSSMKLPATPDSKTPFSILHSSAHAIVFCAPICVLGILETQHDSSNSKTTVLESIRDLAPELPDAHVNLAMSYQEEGRLEEAITSFLSALELEPETAETHTNLAFAHQLSGNPRKAILEYEKAIKLNPSQEDAHLGLAILLMETNDPSLPESAESHLLHTIKIAPENLNAQLQLGKLYSQTNKLADAIKRFDTVRSILETQPPSPSLVPVYTSLAGAYQSVGQAEQSLEIRTAMEPLQNQHRVSNDLRLKRGFLFYRNP